MYYYYDQLSFFIVIVSLMVGLGAQLYISGQYRKYMKVQISTQLTGAQIARRMLDANGLGHVPIQVVPGKLTDNYDSRTGVLSLSQEVFEGRSVAATAIACHECGHAVQHAAAYAPMRLRTALWPAANIASNLWAIAFMLGLVLAIFELVWVAALMFAAVLAFQLVTLPVEFNASARATAYISTGGFLPENESKGIHRVLTAAALTYVAGALVSVLQMVRLVNVARRR